MTCLTKETLNNMAVRVQEIASYIKDSADKGRLAAFIVMGILGLSVLVLASSNK